MEPTNPELSLEDARSISGELWRMVWLAQAAADPLQAKATEAHDLAQGLGCHTKDTPAWYAVTRASVEARAALEQVEELRLRALKELGKRLRE